MTTFYLDPVNGNDTNDGSTWALAWKTVKSGATAARIDPGDEIRICKSPDPVSIGSCAWTKNDSTVTIPAGTIFDIDTCEAAWTPSTNITASTHTPYYIQGAKSASLAPATAFTTGLAGYKDISVEGAGIDLSDYTKISCWVAGSAEIAANIWRLDLCENADGTGALVSFTFDAIIGSRSYGGSYVTFDNGSALPVSVKSVALTALSDPGTTTLYIDNVIACNDLHHNTVISPNSAGPWFSVRSISGTTVNLGFALSTGYFTSASVTQTSYARGSFASIDFSVQDSGTFDNPIVFSGGWNTSTDEQDGETWLYPVSCRDSVVSTNSKNYITIEKFGFFHSNASGITQGTTAEGSILKDVQSTGCLKGLFYTSTSYIYSNISLEGTIVLTGPANAGCLLSELNKSTSGYDLKGSANVDIYGLSTTQTMQTFTGFNGRFTGKWRFFGNSGNIATCMRVTGGDWFFNEVECYETGISGNSIVLEDARIRINKLTISNSRYMYCTRGLLDVGNLVYDNIVISAKGPIRFERFNADNRYKAYYQSGIISDHITGGQASDWAYGGEGLSLLLNPTSQTQGLYYEFFMPVSAGVTYQTHFQKIKTSSGANCTLDVTISGCGITVIRDESVSLTDSWAEFTSSSFTPTFSGYIRCELHALDGSTTGDIGIDDIHLAVVS